MNGSAARLAARNINITSILLQDSRGRPVHMSKHRIGHTSYEQSHGCSTNSNSRQILRKARAVKLLSFGSCCCIRRFSPEEASSARGFISRSIPSFCINLAGPEPVGCGTDWGTAHKESSGETSPDDQRILRCRRSIGCFEHPPDAFQFETAPAVARTAHPTDKLSRSCDNPGTNPDALELDPSVRYDHRQQNASDKFDRVDCRFRCRFPHKWAGRCTKPAVNTIQKPFVRNGLPIVPSDRFVFSVVDADMQDDSHSEFR